MQVWPAHLTCAVVPGTITSTRATHHVLSMPAIWSSLHPAPTAAWLSAIHQLHLVVHREASPQSVLDGALPVNFKLATEQPSSVQNAGIGAKRLLPSKIWTRHAGRHIGVSVLNVGMLAVKQLTLSKCTERKGSPVHNAAKRALLMPGGDYVHQQLGHDQTHPYSIWRTPRIAPKYDSCPPCLQAD